MVQFEHFFQLSLVLPIGQPDRLVQALRQQQHEVQTRGA